MIPLVYDQLNKFGKDDEFFLRLLKNTNGREVADLGCGTGRLTLHFVKEGLNITAIDPNQEAIELAKTKELSDKVNWIVGDSNDLKTNSYDAIVMTANVAQVFLTDDDWKQVVSDVYRSLKEGGCFIFDTRNPLEVWKEWMKDETPDLAIHPVTGEVLEVWTDYEGMEQDIFTFYESVTSVSTNKVLTREKLQLRFRSLNDISNSLNETGFFDIKVYGDWEYTKANADSKSLIFCCLT